MEKWTKVGEEEVKTLIGGDFNARTGREGERIEMMEKGREREKEGKRRSKDGKMNKEGKRLVEFFEKIGWSIFNGNIKGDEERKFMFIGGKGSMMIDYVVRSEDVRSKVGNLRIGDRVDSDQHSLEVLLKGEVRRRERGKGEKGLEGNVERGRKKYAGKVEKVEAGEDGFRGGMEGNGGEIEGSDERDGGGDERDLEEKEKKRGMVG